MKSEQKSTLSPSFVLIMASQRTGSTLFSSQIENLGVGAPREHAMPFIRRQERLNNADLDKVFKRAKGKREAGDTYALKAMLNYTPKLVRADFPELRGMTPTQSRAEHAAVIELFIQMLEKRFRTVPVFLLTRDNILEVASSRALAQLTQRRHTKEASDNVSAYDHIPEDRIIDQIISHLPRAFREKQIMHLLKERLGSRICFVQYEQLVSAPQDVENRCKRYLADFGFEIGESSFQKNGLKKVVPQNFKDQYISRVRNDILHKL